MRGLIKMNEKENDRWNTINEQFKEIEYLFMGMNTSISKLMGDEKGEITDTRIKEFLSSLLSNKDIKRKYDYNVRYYGLFLYLVCRAFDPKQRLKTIGDLMEITEEIENAYTCYDELIMHEYDGKTKGFFTEIHKSCIILTGCSLADDFSDDDYAKICEKVIQKKKAFRYLMLSEEQRNAIRAILSPASAMARSRLSLTAFKGALRVELPPKLPK